VVGQKRVPSDRVVQAWPNGVVGRATAGDAEHSATVAMAALTASADRSPPRLR